MIPFATKNQLNQVEKHLEEKTQTPPNAKANDGFGYIHELAIRDDYNTSDEGQLVADTLKLFVRLDTEDAVPEYQINAVGTAEATAAFLAQHLINVLYYKFDGTNEETGTTETYYDGRVGLQFSNDAGGLIMYPSHGWMLGNEYYIDGIEDITE